MKRLLKRTLSLILAMIMVMGVLPMNAMAAMVMGDPDDVRAETPVIDRSDPIANTHAVPGMGGDERPEIPVPGPSDEPPADPLWTDLSIELSFVVEGGKVMYVVDVTSETSHGGGSSGTWALAIVPELNAKDYFTPSAAVGESYISASNSNNETNMKNNVKSSTGLADNMFVMHNSSTNFVFNANGYQIKGEMPDFNDLLAALQDPNDDVDVEGASFLDVLTGIPFTAILFTQQSGGGIAIAQADYHPAGHIRDEVYTLDLSGFDPTDSNTAKGIYDGGGEFQYTYNAAREEISAASIPVQITNDGTATVTVLYDQVSVLSGGEFGGVTVHAVQGDLDGGTSNGTLIEVNLALEEGGIAAFAAGGGTVNLSVPYTQDGSDSVQYANITINIFASPLVITVKPLIFIMTEGDTATQTKTAQISANSMGIYVPGGIEGYPSMTYESNLFLSGGGDICDDPDAEFNEYALIYGEDTSGSGLSSAPVQVTFDPAADLDSMEFVANEDDTPQTYIDQIVVLVFDENWQYTNMIVPVQIVVRPKLRTQYTLSYDVNGNDDATAPPSSSMYPADLAEEGDPTSVTVANGLGDNVGGKKFLGWSEDPGASAGDPVYAPGTEIELERNVKLYAIWETNKVTITFHKNDGVTPEVTATVTGEPGKALSTGTGTVPTWTRTGYTKVAGWFTGPNDTDGAANTNVFPVASMDVYAHWTPNDITITYTRGACAGATFVTNGSSQTVKYDQTDAVVRTTAEVFASIPTGWNFVNWKVSDTKSYAESATFDKITGPLTLTAQWTINVQFDVTSERPSGSVGTLTAPATQAIAPGGTLTSVPAAPGTLTGYTFDGWYQRLDNGSLGTTKITTTTTFSNPTTLVAKWTIDQYTLTYDTNGHGSVGTSKGNINHGTTETLVDPAANKKTVTESNIHWVWQGWAASNTSTSKITTVTMDSDKTVYAIWEKDTHTVSYDGNSGTLDSSHTSTTKTCGDSYTVSSVEPTRTGYVFAGWNTEDDGSGTSYAKGATISSVTGDITLYAQWTVDQYKVTFMRNYDSTDTTVHDTKTTNYNTALGSSNYPTNPTRTGYTFGGWYPNADGSGTAFTNATEVTANRTVYAVWTANEHTITYHVNGPTGGSIASTDSPVTFHYGDTGVTAKAGTIIGGTITGWNFVKWNTAANGSGTDYAVGDTLPTATTDADINLYAQWTVDVTFDLNVTSKTPNVTGTSAVPAVQQVAVGGKATKPATDPTASNWTFDKWVIGSTEVNFGTRTFSAPTTILATWKEKDTEAIFDLNYTGAAAPTALTGTPGGNVTTGIPSTTRSGWRFDGWFNDKTAGTKVDPPKFPAAGNPAVTYYAHWTQLFTVSYDMQGHGSNPGAHTDVPDGTTVTAKSVSNVTGYTFKGWATSAANATAGTVAYAAGATTAAITADTTLYAVWEVNAHTITYNKNNGPADAVVPSVVNTTYGATETVGTATTATAGWTFMGWSRSSGNQTVSDAGGSTITMGDADITLYAQWNIAISFDVNDPQTPSTLTDPADRTTTVGGTITLPSQADLADYAFQGWYTAKTGGTKKENSDTYSAPTTLYAQWKAQEYTYTFNPNGGAFPTGTTNTSTTGGVGTTISKPSNDPTRKDYTFQGWAGTKALADAGTVDSTLPDATMPSGGKTIYAVWQANEYDYIFDANGGAWAGGATTQTNSGLNVGASVAKWATDPTWADHAFKGWASTPTGTTPLNWPQTMPSEPTGGKVTVYAIWVPVYDVTYVSAHGTVDTTKNVVDHEAWTYTVLGGSAVIPAGTGESWSGTYFTDAAGKHWKFNGWKASSDSSKTYNAGDPLAVSQDVTLTAQWDEYYQVTLAQPVLTDTATVLGSSIHATVSFDGNSLNSSYTNKSVWVKKDAGMAISSLALSSSPTSYIFAKWTQNQTGATAGTFTTAAGGTSAADTFTPKADTTLTPNYWQKPILTQIDSYHQNKATGEAVTAAQWGSATNKKGTNTLPAFTWTKNSATLAATDGSELEITLDGGTTWTTLNVAPAAGTGVDVVRTTDASGNVTYTFQRDYLLKLKVTASGTTTHGNFTIRVKSNTPDTTTTNNAATPLTATLQIAVNPDPLTEVNIQVEDKASGTANVGDTAKDSVIYKDHKSTTITKTNQLTYTWYVSNGATTPTQKSYSTSLAGHATSVSGAKSDAAALGTVIGTADTTNDFVNLTAAHKGKYIYAVVVATNTGYGAVITNPIAVDYDAVVKVTKDGTASITGANYTVYLVPRPTTGSNPDSYTAATLPTTKVEATYQSGNEYKTVDSALTGGVTYDIYVNKVEGDTTLYMKTASSVSTQTAAGAAPVVPFFSVNAVDTTVKHAKDSNGVDVGETFAAGDAPGIAFTTPGAGSATITVTDGNGVYTGSVVTAKTDSDSWGQDYNVDWGKATTTLPAAGLTYNTTVNQSKADAKNTGTTGHTISAKTWLGAQLDQNVYTVTGNIWVNGANAAAGILTGTNDVPTLTYKNGTTTYVFKADTVTSSGGHKGDVTFTTKVPKSSVAAGAITGKYDITATPKANTTIIKYIPGQNKTTASDTSIKGVAALGGTNANTLGVDITANDTQAFTIVLEASTYILHVTDDDTTAHSAMQNYTTTATLNPPATSGGNFTNAPWTVDYAYTSGKTYTITVTNQGNTTLDVSLNILKATATTTDTANNGYIYGAKATQAGDTATDLTSGGVDAYNNTAFADLVTSFTLAPAGTKTFTVTVPTGMDVNKTARYDFQFTSTENGKTGVYGPSVTYRLTETINPLKITKIGSTESSGVYSATGLELNNSATIPAGVTLDNEVEYKWYVTTKGVTPTLTKTGVGTLSTNATLAAGDQGDGTYKLAAADQGKSLWVVAHNQNRGNVIEAAIAPVADLPYDLNIQVNENSAPTASEGNYKVYLWPTKNADGTNNTDTFATTSAKAVEAVSGDNTTDGLYKASNLGSDMTYKVYTNAVGGTTNANWQDSGVTVSLSDFGKDPKVVTYRNVILSNTTVSNQRYNAAIAADTTDFLATYTGTSPYDTARTDALKAPTAKVGTTDVATSDVNKWVQSGTTVDLSYANWNRDYKLTWTGVTTGATVNTAPASGTVGGTATKQVNDANTTIGTALTLNLYDVTAYVVGENGSLSEINLTGKDGALNITTAASASGKWTGTASALSSIVANGSATLSVPAGSYAVTAVKAAGTTIDGYRDGHNVTTNLTDPDKLDITVTANRALDILIHASGQTLSVVDNAKDQSLAATNVATSAGYSGEGVSSNTGSQEIRLPYGYTAKSFTLTASNTSATTDSLYKVTMNTAGMTNASITVTDPANAVSIPLNGTADIAKGDSTVVTISIAAGLPKGTYDSTLTFTFINDEDNPVDPLPTATYNLKVVVEPAEFTEVSITKASASPAADIGDGTMVALGEDIKPFQYKTEETNLFGVTGTNAIVEGTDYTYEWYATPADKTLTGSWAAGKFTPATAASATKLTPKTGTYELEGSTIANYPGQKIWLVVTAENGKNVEEHAISKPVTTGFQPVVKVSVDGTTLTTDPGANSYVVTITDGTSIYPTVWDDTAKGYVPVNNATDQVKVSLDANKEYTASVNKYKGGAANDLVAQTTKLSNASAAARTITVPYFTVNAVAVKDYEAISGLGESVTVPTPTFTLNGVTGATITSDVPVLQDQKVDAKMGTWTEDYKLTWYTKVTTTAPVPGNTPTVPGAYANTSPTMDKGATQDVTAATGTGITGVTVSGKLYIGGRLDQNTYTITGKVVGTTGSVQGVKVEQVGADDSVVTTYVWPDNHSDKTNSAMSDGNGNGKLENNETVTFTVVKGDFTITSTPDGSTVIEEVVWEPAGVNEQGTVESDKTGLLTKKNVAALSTANTKTAYNFEIRVVGSSLSLSVTDAPTADGDAANDVKATSSTGVIGVGPKTVVRYFNYIDKKNTDSTAPDVTSFPLVLENAGNMDLDVALDVFYFDTTKKGVLNTAYYGTDGNWEGTGAANTPVFTAGSAATNSYDISFASSSGEVVLNLADVMKTGTTVPAGAAYKATYGADDVKAVAAATLNLGEDAWSKDSGVFVFRFKGTSTAGTLVVYYVLDLTVKQLPIVEVSTQVNGDATATGMPGKGDKLQAKGFDATTDQSLNNVMVQLSQTTADKGDAATANLTDNDVYFAWVSVPGTETANKATILSRFTVDANGKLVTSTTGYTVLDTNANAKEYTLTAADMDRDFYLIAYAPNPTAEQLKTNAESKAISDVVKTKRTVGVKVSLDGNPQPMSGNKDPEYTIYLVEDGKDFDETNAATGADGTWATSWNATSKRYEAAIDVDNTLYHIYAPNYKGSSTYVDTGLTLGKQADSTTVTEETVPYFSVAHTTNVAVNNTHDGFVSYLPDSTKAGKADNQVQDALTVKVSKTKTGAAADGDTLPKPTTTAPSTPVLKDMKVQVTVDAAASSNNADTTGKIKKSWSQATDLHTMTTTGWQPGTDISATTTTKPDIPYPADDGDGNFLIQSADITVTSAKSFSATLRQVLFEVTFVVKDNTPDETNTGGIIPRIVGATLKTDTSKETATEAASFSANASSITNGTKTPTDTGADGAKVTFQNIPAGAFVIKATEGEKTNEDGYTWNAEDDALNNPVVPGAIVQVTSDGDLNTHEGNTIQIQYGSNAVKWFDNFIVDEDYGNLGDAHATEFFESRGFEKVDTTGGSLLALTEGYSTTKGDVLTYKVRVTNNGANPLPNFRITQDAASLSYLTAGLTKTTVYDAEGNAKSGTVDVSVNGFTLAPNETVEFTVEIPVGQAASISRYDSVFTAYGDTDDGSAITNRTYRPTYQVKPLIEFEPGKAQVIFGNNHFEDTPKDITPTWDVAARDPSVFTYSVLTEEDLADYLDGAARPANVYTQDGKTGGESKLPAWLVFNTTTGAVTFDANLYATDVNVQVDDATSFADYTASEVDNEVVFYIKVEDTLDGAVYYTTYTVDVEPGQLAIEGGNGITLNGIAGQAVNKGDFVYDKVVDQATNDVVPAATAPDTNTANGNDPASATSGKVFVTEDEDSVHTVTWTVAATAYALGVDKHTFTVTYKPLDAAEKWNYKPATKDVPAVVVAPALSLDFADEIKNYDDVKDVLKLGEYSEVEKPEDYDPDTATQAPEALAYTEETYRKGEAITYLDEEPIYTVYVKKIGGLYNMSLTEDVENTKGFQVVDADGNPAQLPKFTGGDQTLVFYVKLSEIENGLWAGEHKIKFTAAGYTTDVEADQNEDNLKTATYELEFTVAPKTIPKAHVTGLTDPKWDEKPDKDITVTGEDPTDPTKDVELDKFTDKHGNHPIQTPEVKITPTDDPYKPGKDYTTTVTLIPDPNYTFEDKTPEEEAPNYTAGGETPDEDYTVTVTPDPDPTKENEKVEFTKTVPIPAHGVLKFDDKKVDDGATSANDPATKGPEAELKRGVISITKGGKLGKYEINLGAYDNDITDVTVTQTTNTLPAEGLVWALTPTSIDKLEKDGDKTTYTLDMTGVNTENLTPGTYTLQLTAVGTDPNGRRVEASYTLAIQVTSPPAGGGGGPAPCPNQVSFLLGLYGTTNDPVMEMVANRGKVKAVPGVTAVEGYKFLGWSQSAPTGELEKDAKRELVEPQNVVIDSDMTFYAVYGPDYRLGRPYHEHYVIGYPNGNFGPADNINRASVATIIARAVLPNFVEGGDYGNPGGYSDVSGHWAASAIAYCSKYGVFQGYNDGTFKPDQSITRQELALVMARLSGIQPAQEMPFVDLEEAGDWAVDGIYTAYANGWVNGYVDGTFQPLNPIRRDETVKIFNAYLYRGVNEEGLGKLVEYVHSGVASNVTENGATEYMTWPDVTRDQWAYYEIIEAANDHEYVQDTSLEKGYTLPETWDKCWIDEKWRYHDDLSDGGPTMGLLSAGFRVWTR